MFIPTIIIISFLLLFAFLAYLGQYTISVYGLYVLVIVTVLYLITFFIDAYKVIVWGYAPYIRTSKDLIKKIIQEVNFNENATVYELGCGDGRFLRELSKNKNIRCIGYEYSPAPYLLSRMFNLLAKKKIKVYFKNFFKENLSDADYIFCYLIPGEMDALQSKFENELKSGTIIISNTFSIKKWQPLKVINLEKRGFLSNKIYIYKI
jgi:SAM-dependent methyltransferase